MFPQDIDMIFDHLEKNVSETSVLTFCKKSVCVCGESEAGFLTKIISDDITCFSLPGHILHLKRLSFASKQKAS